MSTVQKSIRLYAWKTNYHTFRIVQGEVDSRCLNIQLFSTTMPVVLDNCMVSFYIAKPDSTRVLLGCEILDSKMGLVSVTLTNQVSAVDGMLDCWIQVVSESGTDLRFEGMNIEVGECDLNEVAESSNEFGLLTTAMADMRPATARANEAANVATAAAASANSFGAYAKQQGDEAKKVVNSIGDAEATARAAAAIAQSAAGTATESAKNANDVATALEAARKRGDFDGRSAYDFAKEDGYQGTEEEYAEDMNPDRLKAELEQIEVPEIVTSKAFMTDPNKHYVYDGYIYAKQRVETGGGLKYINRHVVNASLFNKRLSGGGGTWGSGNTAYGCIGCDRFDLPDYATQTPYRLILNWEVANDISDDSKVLFYNSAGTKVGHMFTNGGSGNCTVKDGKTIIDLKSYSTTGGGSPPTDPSVIAYIKFQFAVSQELVTAKVANTLEIYIEHEAVNVPPSVSYEWLNSGIHYAPTFRSDIIGVLGPNNVIYVSDNSLPAGTYTLKYADGNYGDIGPLHVD